MCTIIYGQFSAKATAKDITKYVAARARTVRAKEPRKPSRKLIRIRTKSLPGFRRRSPQGVDMCGLWHGSAWFQGICVVWAIIWQKSLWNPHDPKKHGFSWFCRYKGVFWFCCGLLVLVPIQWCPYSAIHDVYPSLSKQAHVTTTIWRLAGLNLNALWSGTLILLTLYVSIDISQWQVLIFLHHCDTRCLLPMFGTAAGAEATNDPCCLSFISHCWTFSEKCMIWVKYLGMVCSLCSYYARRKIHNVSWCYISVYSVIYICVWCMLYKW